MTEIVWHGRGGQGAFTAARLLGIAASIFTNKYALSFPSFGPERRGAPVLGYTKIDEERISDRSEISVPDYRIYLDKSLYDINKPHNIKENGHILINSSLNYSEIEDNFPIIGIDASGLALEILGKSIVNTAMLGVLAAVQNEITVDSFEKAIALEMSGTLAQKNIDLLYRSFNETKRIIDEKACISSV